ncbi:hypothetical protein BLNAU_3229 [Blattamonas nauphoetae]|uniref:Uncharacterized protein n=1 Tax=Blattamonas nauphoetae TaxID=2049346 RepID=A0ABQ9YDH3_9EUKA|nr:hypothetical protein BLNAU_3229 [Blattamonas nauphoetae]
MEDQRREFRKGQTNFELDSIFVCSTPPLSDLTVSLDVKPPNDPKTVRDAIDKNDSLDEKAQSLMTIKIVAPDEFDEVVFPEEFNSIAGAGQGSTGPKKPNLTMSVPSGGDSDAIMKSVASIPKAEVPAHSDSAVTLLQKKLPLLSIFRLGLYRVRHWCSELWRVQRRHNLRCRV